MCTVVLLRRPCHPWPLILAANRDEMAKRRWRPPGHHWADRSGLVAGLDEEAGGSWLGLNKHGIVGAVLNRVGSLGPAPGKRSRGELILRALDEPNVEAAASAICSLNPYDYRSFNVVIADRRSAFWIRNEDESPNSTRQGIKAIRVGRGLSMVTAHNLNDTSSPRISGYLPRFRAARPPDPDRQDWRDWEALLASRERVRADDPGSAMTIVTGHGFETTSSSLIALPNADCIEDGASQRPIWRFAPGRPDQKSYQEISL